MSQHITSSAIPGQGIITRINMLAQAIGVEFRELRADCMTPEYFRPSKGLIDGVVKTVPVDILKMIDLVPGEKAIVVISASDSELPEWVNVNEFLHGLDYENVTFVHIKYHYLG